MDVQNGWDKMCEAYIKEDWETLERVGAEVRAMIEAGGVPNTQVKKGGDLGKGFVKAMNESGKDDQSRVRAGVEFIMNRFKRT